METKVYHTNKQKVTVTVISSHNLKKREIFKMQYTSMYLSQACM